MMAGLLLSKIPAIIYWCRRMTLLYRGYILKHLYWGPARANDEDGTKTRSIIFILVLALKDAERVKR